MTDASKPELISLSDLIAQVKSDLLSRPLVGDTEDPLYYLDSIELTAQVVASRTIDKGGNAGVSLSVLGFSAEVGGEVKSAGFAENTQTVRLTLSPLVDKAEFVKQQSPEVQQRIRESAAWNVRSSEVTFPGEQS